MELNEYQLLANQTDQQPETRILEADPRNILVPLLGLAGEVGDLLSEHKKQLRDGDSYKLFPDRVKEELGDLLWYLSNVATKHGLALEDTAIYNLGKAQRRWQSIASGEGTRRLFDEDFPEAERLPRQMDISIGGDSGRAVTTVNVQIPKTNRSVKVLDLTGLQTIAISRSLWSTKGRAAWQMMFYSFCRSCGSVSPGSKGA